MIPYIFHISILVAICYVFYILFLEKETFYQLNRWLLIAGIMLAFALPFYQIPQEYSLRKVETPIVSTAKTVKHSTPTRTPIRNNHCKPSPCCESINQPTTATSNSKIELTSSTTLLPINTKVSLWKWFFYF